MSPTERLWVSLRTAFEGYRGTAERLGAFALLVLLVACASPAAAPPAAGPAPAPAAAPAVPALGPSAPPLRVTGQKVLVLPVQATPGLSDEAQRRVAAELLFALGERAPRLTWVSPEELQRAVSRSPGFASDPRALPGDPLMHHRERRAVEPLAGELRRYSALTDARLVLLPRSAAFVPDAAGQGGRVRIAAAMIDARTGDVVWFGEVEGELRPAPDTAAVASAAAALAARMLAAR